MKIFNTITMCLSLLFAYSDQRGSREENLVATMTTALDIPQNRTAVVYISGDGGRTWMHYDSGILQEATVSAFLVLNNHIFASTDYCVPSGSPKGPRGFNEVIRN